MQLARSLPARLDARFTADGDVLLIAGLALLIIGFLFAPAFGAQLGAIDDHEIPLMTGTGGRLWPWEMPQMVQSLIADDPGRFRPLYYSLRATEAMVWGQWPGGWYADRLILALATVAGIAWLARPLPAIAGVTIGLLAIVGPAEAWYRLGPQESYATALLVGGLVLLRSGRPWWSVALLLGAAFTKESFAVVIPFVIAWWWWSDRRLSGPLVAVAVGTAGALAVTALTWMAGDQYGNVRTAASVLDAARAIFLAAGPALAIVALASVRDRRLIVGILLALALIVAEGAVYAGLWIEDRYLLPAVLGPILLLPSSLRALPRPAMVAAVALLWLWIGGQVIDQHELAEGYAANTRAFQASLGEVRAHPGPLVITSPTTTSYEPAVAVARYMAGPRPDGECAEVIFGGEGTGVCPTTILVRGLGGP